MDRHAAYRRKFAIVVEELEAVPSADAAVSPLERRGMLHAVQVAVDAAMDLAAMKVKDLGHEVQDDYHNLQDLSEAGVITPQLLEELRLLNGLRNAIVHKYNRFEEETVTKNLERIRATLYAFIERIEEGI